MKIEPAIVAHPNGIDFVVLARRLPINHVFARADDCVATGRATRADALGFLKKPDPHFETKIARSQRADRANVHGVERIIIFETLARMRGQDGMTATIDKAKHVVLSNFIAEPNAARAKDATLIIESDARAEHDVLGFLDFVFEKTRFGCAVLDAEFLPTAFAGLI